MMSSAAAQVDVTDDAFCQGLSSAYQGEWKEGGLTCW